MLQGESKDAQEGGWIVLQIENFRLIKIHKTIYTGSAKLFAYIQFTNSLLGSTKFRFYNRFTWEPLQCKNLSNTPPYYL